MIEGGQQYRKVLTAREKNIERKKKAHRTQMSPYNMVINGWIACEKVQLVRANSMCMPHQYSKQQSNVKWCKEWKKKRITRTEQYQRMKAMATVWRVRRNEFNNSFKHANIHGLFLVHAFGSFSCSFFCYLFFGFPFHFLLIMFLNNRTPLIFFFYIRLDSRTFSSFFKNFLRGDRTYEFSFIGNGLII